jgi:hypothetical protein
VREGSRGVGEGSTTSSGSSRSSDSVSGSSSSSLMFIKFCFAGSMGGGEGRLEGFERPSRRASASERLTLRTLVETDEVVIVESRLGSGKTVSGAGVRETTREGAVGSRERPREVLNAKEGRRGGGGEGE